MLEDKIAYHLSAEKAMEKELIQELWSGYGRLSRFTLKGAKEPTVIAKIILNQSSRNHPRGWNTNVSHQRKLKSYEVEEAWYKNFAHFCNDTCRIPAFYKSFRDNDKQIILIEDLDAVGFSGRKTSLKIEETKLGLEWLANFHSVFMNKNPTNLWENGTYWHLDTRQDEYEAMEGGALKNAAVLIDKKLSHCKYKTFVHGDAKLANFCFSKDDKKLAAVDFQYVGGGCGMKDVIYFIGSCLDSVECETFEKELLDYYFSKLKEGLRINSPHLNENAVEKEWRSMYALAWADFNRFLFGWMPNHTKLNDYSSLQTEKALQQLREYSS